MKKNDLINKISELSGQPKSEARKALDATIEAITDALKAGDKIQLIGFGTFSTSVRPARQGVNPRTGETIEIEEKTVVKFKPSADLV